MKTDFSLTGQRVKSLTSQFIKVEVNVLIKSDEKHTLVWSTKELSPGIETALLNKSGAKPL